MFLTRYEELMLSGEQGTVVREAMEHLVKYGEALGAERFVRVSGVHVTLSAPAALPQLVESYKPHVTTGVRVYTTTHVAFFDVVRWRELGVSEEAAKIQGDFMNLCKGHGVNMTYTCAPYLVGNVPHIGEHVAWMESSAQVYANSVLGARTNREGTYSTLATMVTGRTPYWGMHTDEGRTGTHLVRVEVGLGSPYEYSALGYFAGEVAGLGVPVFEGVAGSPGLEELKAMSASLATSGGVALLHMPGVTPEARSVDEAFGWGTPEDVVYFGGEDLRAACEFLSTSSEDRVDVVVLGCPHASLKEMEYIARRLEGKKVKDGLKLLVCTAAGIRDLAERMGYVGTIEAAGGLVIADTCPAVVASGGLVPKGIERGMTLATDSAKQAHYGAALLEVETLFGSTDQCLEAAVSGKWR
ncbi:MAG: aconitase X [Candidatus Freyarchaeota archaeon]